ncbi:MAG: hypothetical protein H6Q02_828 [Acidobacteria bacterium]|jgi:acyl-coenzyme A thioesterase PaaI-like protein|nr:hypothetical protein [Acidobacteriota bacterium]
MTEWQPTSRLCFVCGRENPVGLKVRWENDRAAGEVRGTVAVPEPFNGYPGVVHGGIVAALLDETAGRTVLLEGGNDNFMVTVKLEVVYERPTPTVTPLVVVGRLRRATARRAEAEGELRLPDGTVTARATVWVAKPPASVSAGWEAERPYWKVDTP